MAKAVEEQDEADVEKPRSDAYVGILAITLVAVLGGAILMFMDYSEIDTAAKGVQQPAVNVDSLEYKQPGTK